MDSVTASRLWTWSGVLVVNVIVFAVAVTSGMWWLIPLTMAAQALSVAHARR